MKKTLFLVACSSFISGMYLGVSEFGFWQSVLPPKQELSIEDKMRIENAYTLLTYHNEMEKLSYNRGN